MIRRINVECGISLQFVYVHSSVTPNTSFVMQNKERHHLYFASAPSREFIQVRLCQIPNHPKNDAHKTGEGYLDNLEDLWVSHLQAP